MKLEHWQGSGGAGLLVLLLGIVPACARGTEPGRVSKAEELRWLRRVIPLPKQIRIERKVRVPVAEVKVVVREGASDVEQSAADELIRLFKERAGTNVSAGLGAFQIVLGVCDAKGQVAGVKVDGARDLATRPNSDQAYVIRPVGPDRLALTAMNERGVYYAAQTLRQLLEEHVVDGTATLPLAIVTDWPDLAERGEWGGNAGGEIEWMSALKMNLVEYHANLTVTPAGKGVATIDPKLLETARLHALKLVPIIMHLDQIGDSGIYQVFPELKGKGPTAQHPVYKQEIAPCLSQPKTAEILADWLGALAAQPGVSDVCVWLSEEPLQCGCEDCRKVGQYVLEAKACVHGWELARVKHPQVRLRILLTQGSYSTNDKVLAAAPPEVGVTYYHGGLTYDSSRNPMIYPLLANYAAQGRWLGCYPQLTASWRIVCPWSGPQFIKARMTEFVKKKLSCLCGYATPNNRLYDFNVTAAAEWSWNSTGRSEREFAAAWATRRGLKDPEAAADWAVTLGPVGWDVYGSGVPYPAFFGAAAQTISAGSRPALGKGMFRYFPTLQQIDNDLATGEKARAIAERLQDPSIIAETQVISGYLRMLKTIYSLADMASSADLSQDSQRRKMQEATCFLVEGESQTVEGLRQWEKAAGGGIGNGRLRDTIEVTEQTVGNIGKALAIYGIQDPGKPYRRDTIGKWESNDFEKEEGIRKQWDVTDLISGVGSYSVEFNYTEGWHGLSIRRLALAAAPKRQSEGSIGPEPMTEVAQDEHSGVAAYENKANTYVLNLPDYDPTLRYFVLADIIGVRSSDKPENRRGCCGTVGMVKDATAPRSFDVPTLLPMTAEGLARFRGPQFSGKGLRVGMVMNGYGSTSLFAALRKFTGIEAQPLYRVGQKDLDACQVVVLPQPRSVEFFGDAQAKMLRDFVQRGGGLIVTHNAVGYRGFPSILPEVCAKGLQHVRDSEWFVTTDHPVTHGLARGQSLTHSYYDHIELQVGPKGVVLAKAKQSARPVVACGEVGNGRYLACGLALGLDVSDNDVALDGAEETLLQNAVRWAGKKE